MPRLTEGSNVNAGTLNPHLPKRTITSLEILDWLNELKGLTKKKMRHSVQAPRPPGR